MLYVLGGLLAYGAMDSRCSDIADNQFQSIPTKTPDASFRLGARNFKVLTSALYISASSQDLAAIQTQGTIGQSGSESSAQRLTKWQRLDSSFRRCLFSDNNDEED